MEIVTEDGKTIRLEEDGKSISAGVIYDKERVKKLSADLQLYECQFTWKVEYENKNEAYAIIKYLQDKLKELQSSDPFVELWCHLDLAYHYAVNGQPKRATTHVQLGELLAPELDKGAAHITQGVSANVQYILGNYKVVDDTLKDMIKYSELTGPEKATILGIKASSMKPFRGRTTHTKSIATLFKEARDLDPLNYRWHLEIGKSIFRMRMLSVDTAYAEEDGEKAIRQAVALGAPTINLAENLRLKAKNRFKAGSDPVDVLHINKEASDLYRKSLHEAETPTDFVKLGIGYSQLPRPFKDMVIADACFQKALVFSQNSAYVLHNYAKFLAVHCRSPNEAMGFLENAICQTGGNFNAHMFLISLKAENIPNYDVERDLMAALTRYTDPELQAIIYCYAGDLYLATNLVKSLKYYKKAKAVLPSFHDWAKNAPKFKFKYCRHGLLETLPRTGKDRFQEKHDVTQLMNDLALDLSVRCSMVDNTAQRTEPDTEITV